MRLRKGLAVISALAIAISGFGFSATASAASKRIPKCLDYEGRLIDQVDSYDDFARYVRQQDKAAKHPGYELSVLVTYSISTAKPDAELPTQVSTSVSDSGLTPDLSNFCAVAKVEGPDEAKRTFVIPLVNTRKPVVAWHPALLGYEASVPYPNEDGDDDGGIDLELNVDTPDHDPAEWFRDVHRHSWYYNAVNYVAKRSIMKGDKRFFRPNSNVTRAEAARLLWNKANQPDPGRHISYRDSVPVWARNAVDWASNNHIMNGYGNGYFGANKSLTRAEAAKIIAKASGNSHPSVTALQEHQFEALWHSNQTPAGLRTYSVWAYANHVINGIGGKDFAPNAGVTRAQMAQIMHNAMENGLM